ncbi:hypothetical protein KGM_204800 [Danaus plexippus plexippus]|uniref:Secreted protein n=1 Tax=Danaus plexippus plexippus TaxID=278856 RepID=A0A212F0G6_DANPL|nr:hypothetical protein KGM_204800 [Danaus plexippus plexippus]
MFRRTSSVKMFDCGCIKVCWLVFCSILIALTKDSADAHGITVDLNHGRCRTLSPPETRIQSADWFTSSARAAGERSTLMAKIASVNRHLNGYIWTKSIFCASWTIKDDLG